MTNLDQPRRPILKPNFDNIPEELKIGKWCCWKAVPRSNGKIKKVPYNPRYVDEIASVNQPDTFGTFDEAVERFHKSKHFAGIGRLIQNDGIFGGDIDDCMTDDGILRPDACSIVDCLETYTEYSPSETGLRFFGYGSFPGPDFNNTDDGVEMYAGSESRFLTVTGCVFEERYEIARPDKEVLDEVYENYRTQAVADEDCTPMPDLLDGMGLPNLELIGIPPRNLSWLLNGFDSDTDRSKNLQATTKELYKRGLNDREVLSILFESPGSLEVAEDHWGSRTDKILKYLWEHHCKKARHLQATIGFDCVEPDADGRQPEFKGLMDLDELDAKLKPISWRVSSFLETNTSGVIFGDPEVYKSFIALDLALCVAYGVSWHGQEVQQAPVIYVAGEGFNGLARRVRAWRKERDLQDKTAPFYLTRASVPLTIRKSAEALVEIVDPVACKYGKPGLIVSDTLARNFGPGDENSSTDMNMYIAHTDSLLRQKFGATVLTVHHTGHSNKQRARGSMALHGAADFEFRVDRENAKTVNLKCTKMKDAPKPEDVHFEAKEVVLASFEDDLATSLVMQRCAPPMGEDKPELRGKQAALFAVIESEAPVERDVLRNITLAEGIFENADQMRRALHSLKEKNLVEDQSGKVVILDPFLTVPSDEERRS
jgi:hypothetical protein